jgi:hypothetical protein
VGAKGVRSKCSGGTSSLRTKIWLWSEGAIGVRVLRVTVRTYLVSDVVRGEAKGVAYDLPLVFVV